MRMRSALTLPMPALGFILAMTLTPGTPGAYQTPGIITLQEPASPFIAFNIWIKSGSASDPKGKEGLASLTASLVAGGATKADTLEAILQKLYPMAAGYGVSVDKEMTNLTGRVHRDHRRSLGGAVAFQHRNVPEPLGDQVVRFVAHLLRPADDELQARHVTRIGRPSVLVHEGVGGEQDRGLRLADQ